MPNTQTAKGIGSVDNAIVRIIHLVLNNRLIPDTIMIPPPPPMAILPGVLMTIATVMYRYLVKNGVSQFGSFSSRLASRSVRGFL